MADSSSANAAAGLGWLGGRSSDIAPRLLGCVLRCGARAGVIVEVEAYEGEDDPASHAHRGPSDRNAIMFGPPGRLYVYRSYGIHWCANVVCGPEGSASAVLIRAVEPVEGIDEMWADRPKARTVTDLGSGPGKLCGALGITGLHNGVDLLSSDAPVRLHPPAGDRTVVEGTVVEGTVVEGTVVEGTVVEGNVVEGPRVGITRAVERPWRFALAGNPHVSRPRSFSGWPARVSGR